MQKVYQQQGQAKAEVEVGIDPGVTTGVALWLPSEKHFTEVTSMPIHEALQKVFNLSRTNRICVRIEDARQRKWFGNAGREQLQGAGSIKRDCSIWHDFLTANRIPFEMIPPKRNRTKTTKETFKALTRWDKLTNEHSRDAAMLVFGR